MAKRHAVPNVLYHYTSIEAFQSIIESKKMRATRYDQMNDKRELRTGVQNLLKAIKGHEADASSADYKSFLVSEIQKFGKGGLDVYVLSLSTAGNSLDQWRAYCLSGGVAIGFDSGQVQKGFLIDNTPKVGGLSVPNPNRHDPSNRLMPCQYTDKNGRMDAKSLAAMADSFFVGNSWSAVYASPNSMLRNLSLSSLSVKVYRTICSIKHGEFASEKEWRSVNHNPDRTIYPVHLNDKGRFYIEMAFEPKDYIKEVWISPHGGSDAYAAAVINCRKKYGLQFTVRRSKIPFRT